MVNCSPDSPQIETDSAPTEVDSTLDSNLVDSEVQDTDTDFSPANVRPQPLRQLPTMLSYHNLQNLIDMQAGVNAIGNRLNRAAFPPSDQLRLISPPLYFYQPYSITPLPTDEYSMMSHRQGNTKLEYNGVFLQLCIITGSRSVK